MADRARPSEEPELLYVSWGGTGRAATVRQALGRAGSSGRGLAYLAILDDSAFGDIDESMMALAQEELAWLLDAQLELTRSQTNLDDVPVRVLVRAGDVADRVAEAVEATAPAEVLIGAPVGLTATGAVADLVAVVRHRVDVPVEIIEP